MESPFPGMDVYLEEPGGWTSVHHRLISVISDTLAEQVAPHFSVSIEERVYLVEDVRDRYITIYDRRTRELVTTIEVLSPWNKARGSRGQREFLAKREAVFATRTHWLEIDLLRAGERPEEVAGQSDYYVLLHHGDGGGKLEVWYIVQAAFTTVYARARYADDIDYTRPVPAPPLRPTDADWVTQQIAAWQAQRAAG